MTTEEFNNMWALSLNITDNANQKQRTNLSARHGF